MAQRGGGTTEKASASEDEVVADSQPQSDIKELDPSAMPGQELTRERALELLQGGPEGVAEFNRLRDADPPDLSGVDLAGK